MTASGYALGAESGHITTKRELKTKPSRRKGVSFLSWGTIADLMPDPNEPTSLSCTFFFFPSLSQTTSKRTLMCREIAREVVGLSPYERRILDMIKTGGSSADKRIYKYAKNRLGSHKRALAKREDIKEVNSKQRARAAGA